MVKRVGTWIRALGAGRDGNIINDGDGQFRLREEELPLRAELYSTEQLERHARGLTAWHQLARRPGRDRLLPRLRENEAVLLTAYEAITRAVHENRRIAPAAEWLLDNFYLIEEQIRTTRRHLPRRYSQQLPQLANGPRAGFPRVYDLALELIQHVDGRVDAASLSAFVEAYQAMTPLTLGELWAIPIMLRLALIENLRRVTAHVAAGRADRDAAAGWAEKMLAAVEKNPADLVLVLADMARSKPVLSSAFTSEFVRAIQGKHAALSFVISWLEQRLSDQGYTIAQLVQVESQNQAADQLSIGNSIGSLRFLGAMDWREFVESMSVVERSLRSDPAGIYPEMDFATRDRYRHVVERLARRSRQREWQVAETAVALAGGAVRSGGGGPAAGAEAVDADSPFNHVGYYLIDRGRGKLEKAIRASRSPATLIRRIGRAHPLSLYVGGITLITAIVSWAVLSWAWWAGLAGWAVLVLAILPLLTASQLAVSLVNWFSATFVPPRPLPRMDYSEGIPEADRTLVVVPSMLSSREELQDLLDGLEIRYLANRDENLFFALLSDFPDADQAELEGEAALLDEAAARIERLNEKYAADRPGIFYLLHRPRRWNPSEGKWMGYERKRGKLSELNALLRGRGRDRFARVVGDERLLPSIRFVLTLDSDTHLPRDAARQLVGTMAHPLNRPRFDEKKGRIIEGYTILQPRVAVNLPSAERSWFVRLFAGEAGIDPYTRAVSDVYQDLFEEGSFIGKGIYDVDAFERACAGRFAENRILSHDLLEGCLARSGLVSDVQLFEEYPSHYGADVSRRHRWIRGDWQIAGWLLPRVRGARGFIRNPISNLSRWKIFDNLRRSLVPAASTALLLIAWVLLPAGISLEMTVFVLAAIALPFVLPPLVELGRRLPDLPWTMHGRNVLKTAARQLGQFLFTIIFLPFDAFTSLDAIGRTAVRMLWTRRRLLEWQTAGEAQRRARGDLKGFFISMWIGPVLAAGAGVLMALARPEQLAWGGPLLALWLVSPAVAWWISRPLEARRAALDERQTAFLRMLSRRTWRYFETFVTAEHNWLPPDNMQEHPVAVVAGRTSPTNIGLSLLANLSAYDLGYLSAANLIDRNARTFGTLDRMERYRGHLFNWYDTRTLKPLPPQYVSTVDSGNLMGHLLVLRQGLLELEEAPLVPARLFEGIGDTVRVIRWIAERENGEGRMTPLRREVLRRAQSMEEALSHAPALLTGVMHLLQRIMRLASELEGVLGRAQEAEWAWWGAALVRQVEAHIVDLRQLAPWTLNALPEVQAAAGASSDSWRQLLRDLDRIPTLRASAQRTPELLKRIDALAGSVGSGMLTQLREAVARGGAEASHRLTTLREQAGVCARQAEMDFRFLYDRRRELLSIGFNVTDLRMDSGFYDLLASEARLTSYVAIAQGQLPQEHWFAMGRLLTRAGHAPALLSWSGSLFEYLMPLLVMPTYEHTLLDETYHAVVARQIAYGAQRNVPWGISESGYNTTDAQLNYQYRAFGVPGLGLKRGLGDDLVIAPYAGVMALMVAPVKAVKNLLRLAADGRMGAYGMYEAVDYTPSRVPPGEGGGVTVRSFMVHHEGMSLLALAYLLLDRPMQRRFMADPLLRANDLLLHERVPRSAPVFPHAAEATIKRGTSAEAEGVLRVYTHPTAAAAPEVHLLSNGRYHVMVSSAGGSYSRWRDHAITRWREDPTRDNWGTFCYLRDLESGEFWSNAFQPTLRPSRRYEAIFSQAQAEFRRRDFGIDVHTQIGVSSEDDVELRRLTVTNRSTRRRTIEVTSYAEVALAPAAAELAHPAFSNLFVQTFIDRPHNAILCGRRPRSSQERPPWMVHLMTSPARQRGEISFETDRSIFLGRNRTAADPAALRRDGPLTNSQGDVLDPAVAARRVLVLEPDESATVDVLTGVAETRQAAEALAEKYNDPRLCDRIFEMAWTHSQVVLQHLNASQAEAQVYGRLAGSLIYPSALRRSNPAVLARNRRGQSDLWGFGISGDLPIVLLRISSTERMELVRQAVTAHAYWRMKGLAVDLVIWNEDESGYRQELQDQIMGLVSASPESSLVDKPGGIFVRRGDQISEEDRVLLMTVARVVLEDSGGTLAEQVERRGRGEAAMPAFAPLRLRQQPPGVAVEVPKRDLVFYNGFGGFTSDGREYVMVLEEGKATPAPWVNVIANPNFGTVVSESGSVYTWSENAHEFRLTPWYNDPIGDLGGEAFYIRDEDTGRFYSPTPYPARGAMPYVCRHGFGYSIYEYVEDGISCELTLYVAMDAPVKFARFKLRNFSGRPRRLSVCGYWEWVLGERRDKSLMHVVTEVDARTGALLARNAYNGEFSSRVAFVDCSETTRRVTGDRAEFLGRNGMPAAPGAMGKARLSGRVGAGFDPCAAMQAPVELAEGQERELVFILGAGNGVEEARRLTQRFRTPGAAREALQNVWNYWNRTLGAVWLETPEPAINMLANGWLPYQVLSSRLWGRTGFYQSGGAFGFRDQLQDVLALLWTDPRLTREHLLRSASRQFEAGDVQHWWHPPSGRGVRTHISDDYLWLPYVTSRYVLSTGDTGVLDEPVPFLKGRPVPPDQESYYDLPQVSGRSDSLYDHCVRAIRNGWKFGSHGLPLMGCGDWNDGMNLVGHEGKGQSVWLAFFLADVMRQFIPVAQKRGDEAFAAECRGQIEQLRANIEDGAWDGQWYRRAYFDYGEPLGSTSNPECQIDSIAQSWAVLSGLARPQRARQAMDSVDKRLVRRQERLIQLFDPPFDHSHLNPGYIKGYLPGVRENGGQYTHAAVWVAMAFAELGDAARAWELLRLINPIDHGSDRARIGIYKVEPYVVAADVYACAPHIGRGGWSWYTGSAGWLYRLIVESLLGLRLEVDRLHFAPVLPPGWKGHKIHYRYRETFYHINFNCAAGVGRILSVKVDGVEQPDGMLRLVDDRRDHHVEVTFGGDA